MAAGTELLERGLHRALIIRGFAAALRRIVELLPQYSTSWTADTEEGRLLLQQIAETALNSKLAGQISGKLATYEIDTDGNDN